MQLQVELNKEDFVPPPGWKWDSDWYISPELRYSVLVRFSCHHYVNKESHKLLHWSMTLKKKTERILQRDKVPGILDFY